jgi:hypothetical protein
LFDSFLFRGLEHNESVILASHNTKRNKNIMNSRTALLFSLFVVASPAASQAAFTPVQSTTNRNQILKPLQKDRMNQHILATILSSVRRTTSPPLAMSSDNDEDVSCFLN